MATIKAIEGRTVHQIQSGQVIVDLCSVVKELVENSLDAHATSIEVRLKNSGLDAIEVQDNGEGISKSNYENIALKHYTSKLSGYDDLTSLRTFGFRGEALSSLCALSTFHVITAQANEAPRGSRLEFATSGKLKGTRVVAAQRGTTITVEGLFQNLPVRRRELEKNIKREYNKVLGTLHAYACISTGVRFVVSNQTIQGKKAVVFATKANPTTRENIANVFGAKTLAALVPLDLGLELQPGGSGPRWSKQDDECTREVRILGHISRPSFGEGRQTPDRQMFFVNSRPCGLPQVAKAFNEVYKTYNLSQSPFVFADLRMDTNSYDVNVSPDKRTILLQDQTALLESLKASSPVLSRDTHEQICLTELFEAQEQTMPQSQLTTQKMPAFRQLTLLNRESTATSDPPTAPDDEAGGEAEPSEDDEDAEERQQKPFGAGLMQNFLEKDTTDRRLASRSTPSKAALKSSWTTVNIAPEAATRSVDSSTRSARASNASPPVLEFNERVAEQEATRGSVEVGNESLRASSDSGTEASEASIPAIVSEHRPRMGQSSLRTPERMRLRRGPAEIATITIGSTTTTSPIGTPAKKRQRVEEPANQRTVPHGSKSATRAFGKGLQAFAAPGTQAAGDDDDEDGDEGEEMNSDDVTRQDSSSEQLGHDARSGSDRAEASADKTDDEAVKMVSSADSADSSCVANEDDIGSDADYLDEAAKKNAEEARVQRLIQEAEGRAARPSADTTKRANALSGGTSKTSRAFSTHQLVLSLDSSVADIEAQSTRLNAHLLTHQAQQSPPNDDPPVGTSPEETLSLTVCKADFLHMRIIGQFNLGFILATRSCPANSPKDLFIIDQHASDEKYNFERLQLSTVLTHQRLVHPLTLALTAIEEEIVLEHQHTTLAQNGFLLDIDDSGAEPVGQRCKLVALPTSKEAVFTEKDLEELLALLSEAPGGGGGGGIMRPTKARKLLAMRACRSSIMIGRTLTAAQMARCVRHMGEIEQPWNCPHGRPTMRHLAGLGAWEGWRGDEDGG